MTSSTQTQDVSSASPAADPRLGVWLILVLGMGVALLRLFWLDRFSFWYDEAMTVTDASFGVERGELANPLGYRLLGWCATWLGPRSEASWRLLSAWAGVCLVPASYWALRAFGARFPAACAALFLAASSWGLYWSQNARFYTLAALCSMLGAGLFLRGFLQGRLLLALVGLGGMALATTFHLSAGLCLLGLGGGLLYWFSRRQSLARAQQVVLLRLLILGSLLALLCLPFGWGIWRTYLVSKQVPSSATAMLASLAHFFASFGFFVTPLLGTAGLCGAWQVLRLKGSAGSFVLALLGTGLLAACAASLFGRVTAQYAFGLLPWLCYLAALPVQACERPLLRYAWVALLTLPACFDQGLYATLRYGDRPRWREAIAYVWQERAANDLVASMAAPIGEHYLHHEKLELRRPQTVAWLDKWRPALPQEWLGRGRPVWIVLCMENLEDFAQADRENLLAFLRQECHLMRRFGVPSVGRNPDVEVYLYPG